MLPVGALPFGAEFVNVLNQSSVAGAVYTWTPPKDRHVMINCMSLLLTCDATVGNRLVTVSVLAGSNDDEIYRAININGTPENAGQTYSGTIYGQQCLSTGVAPKYIDLPWLVMNESDTFRLQVSGIQAGDTMTLITFQYMSWTRDVIIYPEGLTPGGGPTIPRPPPGGGNDSPAA